MEDSAKSKKTSRPLGEGATEKVTDLNRTLPALGILEGLSERSLANLASYGKFHHFPPGTEIIREGVMQNRFYVVVEGLLNVSARARNMEMPLSEAHAGECLGEVSLLEPGPASASVRVQEDATLWSMDIGELREYLSAHAGGAGALLMGMACCLSKRLRQANLLIAQHHMAPVETLPAGRERAITASNAPVQLGFFDKLKSKLSGTKKVQISTKIKM